MLVRHKYDALTTFGGVSFVLAAVLLVVPHRLDVAAGIPFGLAPEVWALASVIAGAALVRAGIFGHGRASLRASLTLTLLIIAAAPAVVAVWLIARQAGTSAVADAMAAQELSATTASRLLADALRSYRGVITTVSSRVDLLAMPLAQQQETLRSLTVTDAFAFSTYDAEGRPIVRSDQTPLVPLDAGLVRRIAETGTPQVLGTVLAATEQPELVIAGPLTRRDGQATGFFAFEVDTTRIAAGLVRLISSERSTQSLIVVDASGRVIIHSDPAAMVARTDLSNHPATVAARATTGPGVVRFEGNGGDHLAGFARVPETDWTVVTEYPLAAVLTGVHRGRELAFGVLVVSTALAGVAGLILAHAFVRPMRLLGFAADSLAAGRSSTLLPRSRFAEIARLADAFRAMRDRLVARTAEREEALAQARDAIRVREEFLSIAAHELKTPITALRGQTQLMLSRLEGVKALEPDFVRQPLLRIDSQSRKLARLTEQLLDISRLEAGHLRLEFRDTDLPQLVEEVVASVRHLPDRGQISVEVPDTPLIVKIDALRFEQVLRNLLDNAAKFSPDTLPVEVTVDAVDSEFARLCVRDHGLGIPPDRREHLFDRFYQAHTDSHRSGLGLGLYISKQIVDKHGGAIRAEFPPDGGARFIVELPLAGRP